ncbi:MAG: PilZ domain-containing protein [Nitrospinae bacterium]|nr:PilZ domain-containing protein [Nitrospinota bacterium]
MGDGSERRRAERDEQVFTTLNLLVQEGMDFVRFTPRLLDYSSTGMRFEELPEPEIRNGQTVVIELWSGDPPEQRNIDGSIVWVSDFGGKVEFGVEYFEEQDDLAHPHS